MRDHDHRNQALRIRAKLAEQLQTLTFLERAIRNRPDQGTRANIDKMAAAIHYLQQAMDALEQASRTGKH